MAVGSGRIPGKARTWYRESDGYRLTEAEAGQLVGFLPSYPWQGSRTGAFQRIGDVVCPPVGAVVLGALTGRPWHRPVGDYLGRVYGGAEALAPVEVPQQRTRCAPSDLLALAA
ncbi:hypothetical protein ACFCXH_01180 [Streptomyces nojiriensis]|uniref:hypothetical protein n=1 Tax=Streptomyces nojiriensis TaxID=66374 RepID=UPI0035DE8951